MFLLDYLLAHGTGYFLIVSIFLVQGFHAVLLGWAVPRYAGFLFWLIWQARSLMAGTVLGAEMEDVILDVMPTLEGILGFTNRWYKDAMRNPMPFTLPNGVKINVIHPVLYIMTKTEAFKSRGNGNYFSSHDFKAALQAHLDAYEDIERSPVVLARFRGMFKDD